MTEFYTTARARAQKTPEFSAVGAGFLPCGEAMPTDPVGLPLGRYAILSTPPPPGEGFLVPAPSGADSAGGVPEAKITRQGLFTSLVAAYASVPKPADAKDARLERWALQAAARRALPGSRTAKCLRLRQKGADKVAVKYSPSKNRASYKNLQTCGSVWRCSCCSGKISEHRRSELVRLVAAHRAAGGQVLFATRTIPHHFNDKLGPLWAAMSKAEAKYKAGEPWKRLVRRYQIIGSVRALEVTCGAHGWHPHIHELIFLAPAALRVVFHYPAFLPGTVLWEDFADDIYGRWASAADRAGLGQPSRAHGVDVRDGQYAAEYASKWGLTHELTKANSKRGKRDEDGRTSGLSPFDLLRIAVHGSKAEAVTARLMFAEYAHASQGKRQLVFSTGLRKLYALEEMDDEEIAANGIEPDWVRLAMVPDKAWRFLLRKELRGPLQEAIADAKGNWGAAIEALIESGPLRLELLKAGELDGLVSWLPVSHQ